MADNQETQNDNEAAFMMLGGIIIIALGLFIGFISVDVGVVSEDIMHFSLWDLLTSGDGDLKTAALIIVAGMIAIILSNVVEPKTKEAATAGALIRSIAAVLGIYFLFQIFTSDSMDGNMQSVVFSYMERSVYWGMIPIGLIYFDGLFGFVGFFQALNMTEKQAGDNSGYQQPVQPPVQNNSNSNVSENNSIQHDIQVKTKKMAVARSLSPQHNGMMMALHNPVTVGRDNTVCKIVYSPDTTGVSGRHCTIAYDDNSGDFIVTDLKSTYGTYLSNGNRLQPGIPVRVKSGESLCIGDPQNVIKLEIM